MASEPSAFTVCARDPDWTKPSVERQAEKIRSDPRYNGFDASEQQAFESRFWRDIGSASGQGRMYMLSGLWTSGGIPGCPNPDINHPGLLKLWLLGYRAEAVRVVANGLRDDVKELHVGVSEANGFETIQVSLPGWGAAAGTSEKSITDIPIVFVDRDGKEIGWIGDMKLASVAGVAFRVCASDHDWVQPSLDWILSEENPWFYYIRGIDEETARHVYDQRIYGVVPGNSVNQGWVALSGLQGVIDPRGCPNAVKRQLSQGRLAIYSLARYEPVGASRNGDDVVVRVKETARGWSDLELTLVPPLGQERSVSFVDESGTVVFVYDLGPHPTPTVGALNTQQ